MGKRANNVATTNSSSDCASAFLMHQLTIVYSCSMVSISMFIKVCLDGYPLVRGYYIPRKIFNGGAAIVNRIMSRWYQAENSIERNFDQPVPDKILCTSSFLSVLFNMYLFCCLWGTGLNIYIDVTVCFISFTSKKRSPVNICVEKGKCCSSSRKPVIMTLKLTTLKYCLNLWNIHAASWKHQALPGATLEICIFM